MVAVSFFKGIFMRKVRIVIRSSCTLTRYTALPFSALD